MLRVLSTPFSKKTQKTQKSQHYWSNLHFGFGFFWGWTPHKRIIFKKKLSKSDLSFRFGVSRATPKWPQNQNGMMAMFFSSLISCATPNWLIFLLFLNMHRFHAKCLQHGRWHLVLLVKSGLDSLDKLWRVLIVEHHLEIHKCCSWT